MLAVEDSKKNRLKVTGSPGGIRDEDRIHPLPLRRHADSKGNRLAENIIRKTDSGVKSRGKSIHHTSLESKCGPIGPDFR